MKKEKMITILAQLDEKEFTPSMRKSLERWLEGDDILPPNLPVKIYKNDVYV